MLTILGLVLVVVSTILIYRTAKQNGHNVGLWTVLSIVIGIGLQLLIPIGATAILAGVWMSSGKSLPQIQEDISGPALIISVVCLILNFVVAFLIMKKVSPLAEVETAAPPPPTDFNING